MALEYSGLLHMYGKKMFPRVYNRLYDFQKIDTKSREGGSAIQSMGIIDNGKGG